MGSKTKHKVLLFKDGHSFSILLKKAIESLGHEAIILDDPTACPAFSLDEQKCSKEAPCADVLLAHCQMESASGIELFKMQSENGCKIPSRNKALMATDPSLKQLSCVVSLGCNFFSKPFSIRMLKDWLDECYTVT